MLIAVHATGLTEGRPVQKRSNAVALEVSGGPRAGKYTLAIKDVGCLVSGRKGVKQFSGEVPTVSLDIQPRLASSSKA